MKKTAFSLLLVLFSTWGLAQETDKLTQWQFKIVQTEFQVGDEVEVVFLATIANGWSLYSSDFKSDNSHKPTEFEFAENGSFAVTKAISPVAPLKKTDTASGTEVTYFTKKAEFRTKVRIEEINYDVTGTIKGQLFDDKKGVCVPFKKTFHFLN